jgi:hypothetical protein
MSNYPEDNNSDPQRYSNQNSYHTSGNNNISGNNFISGNNNIVGNNNTITNRINVNLPNQSVQTGSRVTRSGEPFQAIVLGIWFGLSTIAGIFVILLSPNSALNPIATISTIYFAGIIYSLIGWVLQAAFYYNWNFSNIRNPWLVWCFYPVLSVLGICLWMFWLSARFSYMFRGLFRF